MNTDFPQSDFKSKKFFKASEFQDKEIVLTYKGWDKEPNEDIKDKDGVLKLKWQDRIKYCLAYSYPEWAMDPMTGEKRVNKAGEPFRNRNWDPKCPKGYSIKYVFDEGELSSGSLPLFEAFKALSPKSGERLLLKRTGDGKETKWEVARVRKDGMKEVPAYENTVEIEGEEAPF